MLLLLLIKDVVEPFVELSSSVDVAHEIGRVLKPLFEEIDKARGGKGCKRAGMRRADALCAASVAAPALKKREGPNMADGNGGEGECTNRSSSTASDIQCS